VFYSIKVGNSPKNQFQGKQTVWSQQSRLSSRNTRLKKAATLFLNHCNIFLRFTSKIIFEKDSTICSKHFFPFFPWLWRMFLTVFIRAMFWNCLVMIYTPVMNESKIQKSLNQVSIPSHPKNLSITGCKTTITDIVKVILNYRDDQPAQTLRGHYFRVLIFVMHCRKNIAFTRSIKNRNIRQSSISKLSLVICENTSTSAKHILCE